MYNILPVLVFVIGCLTASVILYHSYMTNQAHERTITELNAATYAGQLQNDINRGITITDTLEEIIISENGKIEKFQTVAENLMTDYIQNIQIAPGTMIV